METMNMVNAMITETLQKLARVADKIRNPMSETMEMVSLCVMGALLVIGLINVFLGFRLMRFWMMIGGFVLGAVGGITIGYQFELDRQTMLILAGVLAVGFAALSFLVYTWGIFVFCLFLGSGIAIYLVHPMSSLTFFLCILAGVGMGVLGVKFSKPIIIVGTSVLGGLMAGMAAANLASLEEIPMGLLIGAGIALLGIFLQFRLNEDD